MPAPSFAVIDLETTGFANSDRIIEIGVVLTDPAGGVEKRWRTLVQPNRGFDNELVHGITPSDLVDAPAFADVALRLAELLAGRVVVAHNASFEKRFLANEFARLGLDLPADGAWLIDTMAVARGILPLRSHKLAACLEEIGEANAAEHTALADADATARLLRHLLPRMGADLAVAQPLLLGDADLAVLPASAAALVVRNDGLFGDAGGGDEWMRRITGAAPGIGDDAADEYLALLAEAMIDDRLDDDEIARLHDTAHALELSDDDIAELHGQYLAQVSVEAWADGVITSDERRRLLAIAHELSVDRATVEAWLAGPRDAVRVAGGAADPAGSGDGRSTADGPAVNLRPGDRVTFTGAMAVPRDEWSRRATEAGLDVGGVCRRSVAVVAADLASMSGKAKKARQLGVPIIDERAFARALAAMMSRVRGEEPAATAPETDLLRVFPWLAEYPDAPSDVSGVVEAWLDHRRDQPLYAMSPVLDPAVRPEGIDAALKTTRSWFEAFPEPLAASAAELSALRHVGRVKLRSFVYATALQAIDDAMLDDAGAPAKDQPVPSTPDAPPLGAGNIIAGWASLSGALTGDGDGDAGKGPGRLPSVVRDALAEAGDPADRVIGRAKHEIDAVIGTGDVRLPVIVRGRATGTATPAELGEVFGVSEERIRQLGRDVFGRLREAGPACALVHAAVSVRFGPCTPVAEVLAAQPGLGETPGTVDVPLLELLPFTVAEEDASWRIEDGRVLVGDAVITGDGHTPARAGDGHIAARAGDGHASVDHAADGHESADDATEAELDEDPGEAGNLYLRDGVWMLLVTVNGDHLRGSGTGIPGAVIAGYGLRHGESLPLPSRLGPQNVSWRGTSTSTGTVSRFMEDLGCAEGDRVWMVFGDEFDVVPATPRRDDLDGARELLNATGMDDMCDDPGDHGDVLRVINEAIGLPADAPRRKTVARFRHRRDDDLAELIREL